jgi:hypothetical protein
MMTRKRMNMRTMEKRTLEGTMNELGRIGRSSKKKIGRGGGGRKDIKGLRWLHSKKICEIFF